MGHTLSALVAWLSSFNSITNLENNSNFFINTALFRAKHILWRVQQHALKATCFLARQNGHPLLQKIRFVDDRKLTDGWETKYSRPLLAMMEVFISQSNQVVRTSCLKRSFILKKKTWPSWACFVCFYNLVCGVDVNDSMDRFTPTMLAYRLASLCEVSQTECMWSLAHICSLHVVFVENKIYSKYVSEKFCSQETANKHLTTSLVNVFC